MPTPVETLELPQIPFDPSLSPEQTRRLVQDARSESWLAQNLLGYVVTTRDATLDILKDDRWHQASRLIAQMNGITDERYLARQTRPSILSAEGEVHQRLRRLVSPAFTPRRADALRPFMVRLLHQLVDDIEAEHAHADGSVCFDAVSDLCRPYPIPIICELLGAPADDWPLFSRWADEIFQIFNRDLAQRIDEVLAAQEELDAYSAALIAQRRSEPRDDLLSVLIAAEEEGDRLDNTELVMLTEAVLLAGTDTTRNQLACALALFAQHNDQWQLIADDPDQYATRATEEAMRYLGAVRGTGRFASQDIELNGVLFPKGTLVFPSFVAANTDPAAHNDPDTFDITNEERASHLTLGFGLHYCLGANLARAELQEALTVLAKRMPDLRLDGAITWKPDGVGIWGPASLPLTYTPKQSIG